MKPRKISYKKKIGNYPYVNVVFSTTLALFIIGFFLIFAAHVQKLTNELTKHIKISIFLNRNVTVERKEAIREEISEKRYIFLNNNKNTIAFISKEKAAKKLIEETGEDFLSFLGENPLHDAFVVQLKKNYYTDEASAQIKSELENIYGIYEVAIPKNLLKEINSNLQKIGTVVATFIAVLLMTITMLVNNAIKLAFFSQRFLIRSMQLVGATPLFIKKPFLLRASWQGALSGLTASLLLLLTVSGFVGQVPEFSAIKDTKIIVLTCLFISVLGIIIGFFSSLFSVNKYIKMKLDDLY